MGSGGPDTPERLEIEGGEVGVTRETARTHETGQE